jgi:hypothetical protein
MSHRIALADGTVKFLGSRYAARPYRHAVSSCLTYEAEVCIDFGGVAVGTSFIDELVGGLIVAHGSRIVDRLVFENCDPNTRGLLQFVVATRLAEQARVAASVPQP